MIEKVLDLHIHSKYSRACSPQLELPRIARACRDKGIHICVTGDFTHPAWFKHLEENLVEENQGMYVLKDEQNLPNPVRFIFGTEISCMYRHAGRGRRIHLLVVAPGMEAAKKFSEILVGRGVNVVHDGRPIMGISAKEIVSICRSIDKQMMVIPAHAWTPWFGIFGSKSGYDSIEECFEELSGEIFSIETGMSSDPTMNHRLKALDRITLVSNSDAHSLENLGREANVMKFDSEKNITYDEIRRILSTGDKKRFSYTIEFYPEEGKYHADGHKDCKVCWRPEETKRNNRICPVCKKPVTVGVLHRVDDLATRPEEDIAAHNFVPHRYIVPLREIISDVFKVGKSSKKVVTEYESMIKKIGSEFFILLHAERALITKSVSDARIADAIENMRTGKVRVHPGYDGVFGTVKVLDTKEMHPKQRELL